MVSFSPVGVSWSLFVFLFSFFPLIAFGAPSSLGSGSSPFFSLFLRVFVFFIMNRLFKCTVVLDGSGFAETVKVEDTASKIVQFFGSENVLSVQFMPGRAIRVTFENESFAATVARESSVSIDNVVYHLRGGGGGWA